MPYKIKAYLPDKSIPFCVVSLTKKYARVLHIPTGLTVVDAMNLDIAYEVCRTLGFSFRVKSIKSAFSKLTWEKYRQHMKGNHDYHADLVCDLIKGMKIPGTISSRETMGLRFKHRPEYVR